jgi:hypothetical protein
LSKFLFKPLENMATMIEITRNENRPLVYNVSYSSDKFGKELEVNGYLKPLDTGRGNEFQPDYIFEGDFLGEDEIIDENTYQEIETEIVEYFYQNQDKIK